MDVAGKLGIERRENLGVKLPVPFKNRRKLGMHAEFIGFLSRPIRRIERALGWIFAGFVEHRGDRIEYRAGIITAA